MVLGNPSEGLKPKAQQRVQGPTDRAYGSPPTGLDRRLPMKPVRDARSAEPEGIKGCTSVQGQIAREPTYGARPAAPRDALMGLDRGRLEDGAH